MPTYCQEKEITYVDHQTGEIINSTQEKLFSYRVKNDDFILFYYRYILKAMTNIKSLKTFNLLVTMASMADYNTGMVSIPTETRECICKELNINIRNFTKYINELKDNKLISGGRGVFYINPKIFWKGDSKTREALLKDKMFYVKFGFMSPNGTEIPFELGK